MDKVLESLVEWLKEILVGGIVNNLSGMFDSVNSQVGVIAGQVGATPQAVNPSFPTPTHIRVGVKGVI